MLQPRGLAALHEHAAGVFMVDVQHRLCQTLMVRSAAPEPNGHDDCETRRVSNHEADMLRLG
jgi:hypothetical protein